VSRLLGSLFLCWRVKIVPPAGASFRSSGKEFDVGQENEKVGGDNIRVSVTCLADFITKSGRSAESRLRPFKFSNRGEGFARSIYYQTALKAIRAYHSQENDPAILEQALAELRTLADTAEKNRDRTRYEHNVDAIIAYRKLYGKRKFKILPNRRLEYRIGSIVVKAQPDLWAEEDRAQVLLKIGIPRHGTSYIDIVLTVLRKAAASRRLRIRAKNFVYLNVSSGREMISSGALTRFNRTFREAARDIASVWPKITES
jgi:hypothetical protein